MTVRRLARVLPFAAAALAACGGGGDLRPAAARADTAARRVWTPEQARALRQARAAGDTAPAPAAVPRPGPAEDQDSAQWAAEEKAKYDQRVRSMGAYADCMAKARNVDPALRPQLEAACHRLPSAPH